MSYKTEFNEQDYKIPAFITEANGWIDESWHNDVCPSFHHPKLNICVWVGDTEKADCQFLYCVQGIDDEGQHKDDADLFQTDSEEQLFCFILALQFSLILRQWHTPEQWQEVLKLNKTPEYVEACPSHNYYDANQAMIEAWEAITGREPEIGFDDNSNEAKVSHETELTNAAWEIARKEDFFSSLPLPTAAWASLDETMSALESLNSVLWEQLTQDALQNPDIQKAMEQAQTIINRKPVKQ